MKASATLISALVIATAIALPAQASWSNQLSQPYLGHNAVFVTGMSSAMLHGKEVIGLSGQRLGTVVGVDRINRIVRLRTPEGRISIPMAGLRRFGGDLLALNMTRRDVLAMARRQG